MNKKIPDRIYRDLTISQRILAAWEADKRGDTSEIAKLTNPADAGKYTINRVSAVLNDLRVASMAAHVDILNCVITHLVDLLTLEMTDDLEKQSNLARIIIGQSGYAAAIAKALKEVVNEIGLEPDPLFEELSLGHPIAAAIVEEFGEKAPKDITEAYREILMEFFQSRHPKIPCFHPAKQAE